MESSLQDIARPRPMDHAAPDRFLDADEVRAWLPDPAPGPNHDPMQHARAAVQRGGCGGPGQQLGERWAVGCVALEITQRCNLDCTACYLSEHSEAVHDLPLSVVFDRIDAIRAHYGTGVDVQVTGGDPTLRRRDELIAIVARLSEQGQHATLMTNGIKADRTLLRDLAQAGLVDVAFHVDTTQERKGYATEVELNAVRERYVDAARGLGLSVMFNATIHADNLHEVAAVTRFYRTHADVVRTASFQIQADTGRGTLRGRDAVVTAQAVWDGIADGLGTALVTDTVRVGHPRCSRYGLALVAADAVHDLLARREFVQRLQHATARLPLARMRTSLTALRFARWLARHPHWLRPVAAEAWALLRRTARDVLRARGQVSTLSIMTHDFMHACTLERDRLHACVFKTMTGEGPISMCMHNARRDAFILQPVPLSDGGWFDPLGGERTEIAVASPVRDPVEHGLKRARGRTRAQLLANREAS